MYVTAKYGCRLLCAPSVPVDDDTDASEAFIPPVCVQSAGSCFATAALAVRVAPAELVLENAQILWLAPVP